MINKNKHTPVIKLLTHRQTNRLIEKDVPPGSSGTKLKTAHPHRCYIKQTHPTEEDRGGESQL